MPVMLQEEIQQHRTTERRHMIAAKDALGRGVAGLAEGDATADFVLACIVYLEYIISRFVEQGQANSLRLRAVVPEDDAEDQRTLTDIENTLAETCNQLDMLVYARDQFESGGINIKALETACENFLHFYNSVLAQRKDPAQSIIQKHIDPDTYWEQTNDVTAESVAIEQFLFAKICELAPAGLQVGE